MSVGDEAAAAGYPLVSSSGTGGEVHNGFLEINRTRDFIAELKALFPNYFPEEAASKSSLTGYTTFGWQNETNLTLQLLPSSIYYITFDILYSGAKLNWGWVFPSGAGGSYTAVHTPVGGILNNYGYSFADENNADYSSGLMGISGGGRITIGATGGTFALRVSPHISGQHTNINGGSVLNAKKIG